MSPIVTLHNRIAEALAERNHPKMSRWDDEPTPPENKNVLVYELCSASHPLLCLYQLSQELESEAQEFEILIETLATPYHRAISAVSALMDLHVAGVLDNPDNEWVITSDGKIHEYQDVDAEEKPLPSRKTPHLCLVPK